MREASQADENAAAWRAEMTAINLGRLGRGWIVSIGFALAFAAITPFVPAFQGRGYEARALFDAAVCVALLVLARWARRQPAESPWRMRYVWLCTVVILLTMNSWYFESMRAVGQNSDYVVGVVAVSAALLAPPAGMAVVLAANHALFCAALLAMPGPESLAIAGAVDGTMAVVIAWVIAWFLYTARQAEFAKSRALAATNAELREVMAIAAHELRSPLLGLRDLLRLARHEPGAETATLSRVLDLATESCGGMVRLVSRLVEAHVIEEAQGSLQLVPLDLREVCAAAGERLRPTADAKQQRVAFELPEAPAVARIDATAFAQVIENLVGNALKFSPPGTAVECALFALGDRWCVEVRDEGPSVPADERGRLFQKFHRGRARPTGGETSTGLGLFIVRRLTEAMGGRVSHAPREALGAVRGEPRGSVFRIELPAV